MKNYWYKEFFSRIYFQFFTLFLIFVPLWGCFYIFNQYYERTFEITLHHILSVPKGAVAENLQPDAATPDPSVEARFEQGNEVGDLAMQLFGPFVEVTTKNEDGSLNLAAIIEKTKQEMEAGTEVICEASFSYLLEQNIENFNAILGKSVDCLSNGVPFPITVPLISCARLRTAGLSTR